MDEEMNPMPEQQPEQPMEGGEEKPMEDGKEEAAS